MTFILITELVKKANILAQLVAQMFYQKRGGCIKNVNLGKKQV